MKCFYYFDLITISLFLSFPLSDKYKEAIVYIPITLNFNAYFSNIYIGDPPQKLLLPLDQELQITWADTIHYKKEDSFSSKEINKTKISFRKVNLFGNTISDKIYFINDDIDTNCSNNITINDFWFVVVGNSRGYDSRVGGIGLSFIFSYEEYSLIHHLKKNNLINYLSYGFIPPQLIINNNLNDSNTSFINKEGFIFFGGLPKNYIINKYRYNCKITGKYNFWSCDLPYILFGEITYYSNPNNTLFFENNNYAYFNGAERRILAPEDFMLFLKHNYFKNEIINGTCKYYLYGMNYVFECLCNIINIFPNISFIFDNYQYKFTSDELFDYYGGGNCLFVIQGNHLRKNNFVFGTPFLNKFISNFDYETKYITFYSENKISEIDLDKFFKKREFNKYIIGIFIFISIFGLLSYIRKVIINRKFKKDLLLIKNKKKNKKMSHEDKGYELNRI